MEANILGSAWGLSACRFENYTEIKRKNAGFSRSGRAHGWPLQVGLKAGPQSD